MARCSNRRTVPAALAVLPLAVAVLLASCRSRPAPPKELRLERALPIEIQDDFQPSGLVFDASGRLLTVSDKHDRAVYEIVLGERTATLRPFVSFTPPADGTEPMDFEGITIGRGGELLLASETRYRVLEVRGTGEASWLVPSLEAIGHGAGLFQKHNANLEGIATLPDGHLLLAAERDPRGLIEVPITDLPIGDVPSGTRAWAMPRSIYPVPPGRGTDFADLTVFDRRVYALERNSHLVVRLERSSDQWEEREAWSYAQTENDPRFAYKGSPYGVVEGLAIDREHVYLVTDNNRLPRAADADDHRPQLFVFAHPRD